MKQNQSMEKEGFKPPAAILARDALCQAELLPPVLGRMHDLTFALR